MKDFRRRLARISEIGGDASVAFPATPPKMGALCGKCSVRYAPLYWDSSILLYFGLVALPLATHASSDRRAYRASMKDLRRRVARVAAIGGDASVSFTRNTARSRPDAAQMSRR